MPIRRIGYACPLCDRSGIVSHLYETPPALATRCEANPDHVWTDVDQLRALMPRWLDLPRPTVAPAHRVPLTLQVPEAVVKNLQNKYGEGLAEGLLPVLQYAAQPQFLFLGSDDLERIREKLKDPVTNGAELFAAIFRQGEELEEVKRQLMQLTRTASVRAAGTGVLLDLGEQLPLAVGKAAETGMPVEEYLSIYMKDSLANGWVMV